MPSKNTVKVYIKDGFYHMYNRGVEKREIFMDEQDYKVFLGYLKEYLSPPPDLSTLKQEVTLQGQTFKGIPRQPKNYKNTIKLHAFCLMPNHFHLLVQQGETQVINKFMQSLLTRYSIYFNTKYKRTGSLFQGRYKAVHVNNDSYLLHLSRYIHRNPFEYEQDHTKHYSSYSYYLDPLSHIAWITKDFILSNVSQSKSKASYLYQNFVEQTSEARLPHLDKFLIDNL